jgi:hypothetical protein
MALSSMGTAPTAIKPLMCRNSSSWKSEISGLSDGFYAIPSAKIDAWTRSTTKMPIPLYSTTPRSLQIYAMPHAHSLLRFSIYDALLLIFRNAHGATSSLLSRSRMFVTSPNTLYTSPGVVHFVLARWTQHKSLKPGAEKTNPTGRNMKIFKAQHQYFTGGQAFAIILSWTCPRGATWKSKAFRSEKLIPLGATWKSQNLTSILYERSDHRHYLILDPLVATWKVRRSSRETNLARSNINIFRDLDKYIFIIYMYILVYILYQYICQYSTDTYNSEVGHTSSLRHSDWLKFTICPQT